MTKSALDKLSKLLKYKAQDMCVSKALELERANSPISSLAFRDLNLDPDDAFDIMTVIQAEKLTSLSFSFNINLGDDGAIAICQRLPVTISEFGLVGCGVKDIGGRVILDWMKGALNLRMVCIEQNNFSGNLKTEFTNFKLNNPHVTVIF